MALGGRVTCQMAVGLRPVSTMVDEPLLPTSACGTAGTTQPVTSQPRPSGRSPVATEIVVVRRLKDVVPDAPRFSKRSIVV